MVTPAHSSVPDSTDAQNTETVKQGDQAVAPGTNMPAGGKPTVDIGNILEADLAGSEGLVGRRAQSKNDVIVDVTPGASYARGRVDIRSLPAGLFVDHLLETLSVIDKTGRFVYTSGEYSGLLGYEAGHFVGRVAVDYLHPDDADRIFTIFIKLLGEHGATATGEYRVRAADGSWAVIEAKAISMVDDESIGGILLFQRNITDRVEAFEAAHASEQRLAALLAQSEEVVMVVGRDSNILYLSPGAEHVLGDAYKQGVGTEYPSQEERFNSVHPDDQDKLFAGMIHTIERKRGKLEIEFRVIRDGEIRYLRAVITNQLDNPAVDGMVLNIIDDTARRTVLDRLVYQSHHDALTGLHGRHAFEEKLEELVTGGLTNDEEGTKAPAGLHILFIDLDNFKVVNDSLGHRAGDALLREMARRIKTAVPADAHIARLGGDEFVVLCEGEEFEIEELGNELLGTISLPLAVGSNELRITASIGWVSVAGNERGAANAEDLLRDVDVAMYDAKDRGRNRLARYDEGLRNVAADRLSMEIALHRALDNDEFKVVYQPEVDAYDGHVVGYEALVRWQHPTEGLLAPDAFLPIAEASGLIVSIGETVLNKVLDDLALLDGRVWVNLSVRQLQRSGYAKKLVSMVSDRGIDMGRIGIEVTETALIEDITAVQEALEYFVASGAHVAVDDFGTGNASLVMLKRFPLAGVKIDKSFVDGIGQDGDDDRGDLAVVRAIGDVARALALQVVAEGVERPSQIRALRELGCTRLQGYLMSPGVDAHAACQLAIDKPWSKYWEPAIEAQGAWESRRHM